MQMKQKNHQLIIILIRKSFMYQNLLLIPFLVPMLLVMLIEMLLIKYKWKMK